MDEKNLDFPIFTIEAEELEEKIKEAIEIKEELQELVIELNETKKDMESSGKQLNFYINNIIDYDNKFDYKKHVVIFDDENNLYIYSYKDIKRLDFEKMQETLSLKKELFKQKINNKQIYKCLDLIENHNDIYIDYETIKEDYEDVLADYNDIIYEVEDIVEESNDSYEGDIPPFNKDIHDILMVKFDKEGWKFIYIEKKYKQTLLDSLEDM